MFWTPSIRLVLVLLVLLAASIVATTSPAIRFVPNRRHLRLVLRVESRHSLVQSFVLRFRPHQGCHRDLAGRQMDLISGLKHLLVGVSVEGGVTYMGPHIHR